MKQYQVYFEYYSEGETGNDCYRFTDREAALAKMEELRDAIVDNFTDAAQPETLDEADFYGIIDHATGDYAKVIFKE